MLTETYPATGHLNALSAVIYVVKLYFDIRIVIRCSHVSHVRSTKTTGTTRIVKAVSLYLAKRIALPFIARLVIYNEADINEITVTSKTVALCDLNTIIGRSYQVDTQRVIRIAQSKACSAGLINRPARVVDTISTNKAALGDVASTGSRFQ